MHLLNIYVYSTIGIFIFYFFLATSLLSSEIHKCETKEGKIIYTTNPSTIDGCIIKLDNPREEYLEPESNAYSESKSSNLSNKVILNNANNNNTKLEDEKIEIDESNLYEEESLDDDSYFDSQNNIQRERYIYNTIPYSGEYKIGTDKSYIEDLTFRLKNCVKNSPPSPSRDFRCSKLEQELSNLTNNTTCSVTTIIDGDTFNCILRSGIERTVRLIGINTPELGEVGGREAQNYLVQLLSTYIELRLEYDIQFEDKYGRILAYAYLPNGKMINELLLEEGLAQVMSIPPNVKYSDRFSRVQYPSTPLIPLR